ncbi:MAG: hypothetical protein KGJ23_15390 [Euryarchaeota archaeon]|nr:hypothetical protein [Euryarchaeota archaeon]MDE1837984.1 hypothetical protein [Euryarchaeota archaeon]MDE1881398.1 hypothetical protein [Euryarchaeota archaeon]MDE2046422.1 hypothetical protein [Thermoplasmata archaeon]
MLSLRSPSTRDGTAKVERENRRAVGWMAIVGGVVLVLFAALVATSFTCLLVSGSCDLTEPYLLFVAPPCLVGFMLLLWGCGRLG